MHTFRHIRFLTYIVVLATAWLYTRRATAIPVELVRVGNTTSALFQMGAGNVLSSFAAAEDITAQVIWSDKSVDTPTSADIKVESELVRIDAAAKAKLIAMLSSSIEHDDDGSPCFCIFQPQLRLCWLSADRKTSYSILVSGVSHGEIQSFCDGKMLGNIRDGAFIPAYLKIMDQLFPGHRLIPILKRLEEERQKARGKHIMGLYPLPKPVAPICRQERDAPTLGAAQT